MRKLCVILVGTMMCLGILVQAQEREVLKADIPFRFTVANTVLPAGSYTVFVRGTFNTVRVQSVDGRHVATMHGMPKEGLSETKLSELIFRRMDGEYFLTQAREQGSNVSWSIPLGSRAQELARKQSVQQMASAIPAR